MPFVNTLRASTSVSFGKKRSAAAAALSNLLTWGGNNLGQLGLRDTANRSSPVHVGTLITWSKPAGCQSNSYVANFCTQTDGTLWSWGKNTQGQLGQGNTTDSSSPTQIGALANWATPASGHATGICVKTDSTLWTWGDGSFGALGHGNYTSYSSPVQVGTLTNWSFPSANYHNSACLKTDGTLWMWGRNLRGELGQDDLIGRSSPVQVGVLTTWSKITMGTFCILASTTDNKLFAWGQGALGRLGILVGGETPFAISSPTQVGTLTNWSTPVTGQGHTMCLKTDGTLWSWGYNVFGNLGLGDNINRSSPVQVGALTNWAKPTAAGNLSGCIKTDGTMWVWGRGIQGGTGLGDVNINRSSPVQLGSKSNWTDARASGRGFVAVIT